MDKIGTTRRCAVLCRTGTATGERVAHTPFRAKKGNALYEPRLPYLISVTMKSTAAFRSSSFRLAFPPRGGISLMPLIELA
jgi:hypothetical protein